MAAISDKNIDAGTPFDWGRTSPDYAKYRDIYPQIFYDKILGRNLCTRGQSVLDIGTGTGVLPRNMYRYGASWTGTGVLPRNMYRYGASWTATDVSKEQIEAAKKLSSGMDIKYAAIPAEGISFAPESFDAVVACQCFWYFDHNRLMPKLHKILKKGGRLLVLYMAWLPDEDPVAAESEKLILKYSPSWSGARERVRPIEIPECYFGKFEKTFGEEYMLKVHFTRKSWHGRVKTCRAISASLPPEKVSEWETEHLKMLSQNAPTEFDILHYAAMAELKPI